MKKRKRHLQQKKFITMDNNSYAQLIDDFEKGLLVIEGESLTDYITRMGGVDYDAKANGGIMGYAIGGRTRNLSDVYDNSSVLQDKYSTQQDYLDLFDQSTTTTPTTSTTTITDLIEKAPETMLPPRVRPLLIPQTEGSDGGGGITRARTDMNQPNAMGGKIPGFKAGAQRAFNDFKTAAGGIYDVVKYVNPLDPQKFNIMNLYRKGKEVFSNRSNRIVAEQKAIAQAFEEEMARREEDRIRSQSPTGSMNYGPSGYEGMSDAASDQEISEGGRGSRG